MIVSGDLEVLKKTVPLLLGNGFSPLPIYIHKRIVYSLLSF